MALSTELLAPVYPECMEHRPTVDLSAQSIRTAHRTGLALGTDVLIRAQALVDLMHNVTSRTTNQFANALKAMKVILTLDAMLNKVGASYFPFILLQIL